MAAAIPQAVRGKAFVDFQNDVSLGDVDLAWREGYRSVEHLKRYTTLGMGTDQGKTGNMAALARLAQAQGVEIPQAGLTTFRPPYTPTTLGAFAGAAVRDHAGPVRRLRLHAAHEALGAVWQPVGYWFRPRGYPRSGESLGAASLREARMVRKALAWWMCPRWQRSKSPGRMPPRCWKWPAPPRSGGWPWGVAAIP
jgi:sarcosine oxidase subunit alpha